MPRAYQDHHRYQGGGRPPRGYSQRYTERYGSAHRGYNRYSNHRNNQNNSHRSSTSHNVSENHTNPRPRLVLLTDSILKKVNLENVGGITSIHTGADLVDLVYKQRNGELPDWSLYDLVVIHCGTNDIDNDAARFVHRRLQTLTENIKAVNPYIDIIISSILPRPCNDIPRTDPRYDPYHPPKNEIVKRVNYVIKTFCRQTQGLHFWPSFNTLTAPGDIIRTGFYKPDLLHLNTSGWLRMTRILKTVITRYYRGQITFRAQ